MPIGRHIRRSIGMRLVIEIHGGKIWQSVQDRLHRLERCVAVVLEYVEQAHTVDELVALL